MVGLNLSAFFDGIALLSLMVVKPTAILALVLFSQRYLRTFSASAQHFCLAIGLLSLLLLPVAAALLPPLEWAVLPPAMAADVTVTSSNPDTPSNPETYSMSPFLQWVSGEYWWVFGIYPLGFFWVLFYLLIGVWQIHRQTARSRRCDTTPYPEQQCLALMRELVSTLGVRRPVALVVCSGLRAPQVWGFWKPTIMVPAGFTLWPQDRQRRVLIHELSHIRRCDWPLLLLARVVCAVFWFLPLTWIVAARMQIMAELACDDQVVTFEGQGVPYAEDLLTIVKGQRADIYTDDRIYPTDNNSDVVLSVASGSPVYLRVRALLDSARDRSRISPSRKTLALLLGATLILPLSSLQATVIRESVARFEHAVVRWLPIAIVSLPPKKSGRRETETGTPASTPVLSADKLARLKSRLIAGATPPGDIEEVVVLAREPEAPWQMSAGIGLAGLQRPLVEPQVHIQGYMPLITVTPNYPPRAQRRGIEGRVIVQFTISPQGWVEQPRILVSQPRQIFDAAVLAALEQFRFKPPLMDNQPVAITGVTESFVFRLTDDDSPPEPRRRSPFSGTTKIAQHF